MTRMPYFEREGSGRVSGRFSTDRDASAGQNKDKEQIIIGEEIRDGREGKRVKSKKGTKYFEEVGEKCEREDGRMIWVETDEEKEW